MAVLAPSALALAAAFWSGIGVEAVPPDTRCPAQADVEAALANRVPDDLDGWVAWYRVEAWFEPPRENRLRFELRDATGRLRLRREMAIGDQGCPAAAEGLALIVERYFEEVAWTASVPLPEVERPEEPPPARRVELQVAAAGRREVGLAPALALDLRVALAANWVAVAGLMVQGPVEDPNVDGTWMVGVPVRVSARRSFATAGGATTFEVGPAVGLVVERGWSNAARVGVVQYRTLGIAGVAAAARRPLGPRWTLGFELAADVTLPPTPSFEALGAREVLAPSRVQVTVMVGISRVISR